MAFEPNLSLCARSMMSWRRVPPGRWSERNPHRTGAGWTLRTVAAILANPRYTGRQVRNRQRTDFDLVDPGNTALGHRQVQRWNMAPGAQRGSCPADDSRPGGRPPVGAIAAACDNGPGKDIPAVIRQQQPRHRARTVFQRDPARGRNLTGRDAGAFPPLTDLALRPRGGLHPAGLRPGRRRRPNPDLFAEVLSYIYLPEGEHLDEQVPPERQAVAMCCVRRCALGMSHRQIAVESACRYRLRPRATSRK